MAVTERDVRHVAALARLGIDPTRLPSLVAELNGILEHMEVLGRVETGREMGDGRIENTCASLIGADSGRKSGCVIPSQLRVDRGWQFISGLPSHLSHLDLSRRSGG